MPRRARPSTGAAAALTTLTSSKRAWTTPEDAKLKKLVSKYGTTNWSQVSEECSGRSGKQCRERWHNHLDPDVKKGDWTEEEDEIILTMQAELGNAWAKITKMLPGRTDNAVKNRWHSSMRSKGRTGGGAASKRSGSTARSYTATPPSSNRSHHNRRDAKETKENKAVSAQSLLNSSRPKTPDGEADPNHTAQSSRVLSPNNQWPMPSSPPIFEACTFSFDRGLSPLGDPSMSEWADMMEQDPVLHLQPSADDGYEVDSLMRGSEEEATDASSGLPTFSSVAAAHGQPQRQPHAWVGEPGGVPSMAAGVAATVASDTVAPNNKRIRTFSPPSWVDARSHQSPGAPAYMAGPHNGPPDLVRVN